MSARAVGSVNGEFEKINRQLNDLILRYVKFKSERTERLRGSSISRTSLLPRDTAAAGVRRMTQNDFEGGAIKIDAKAKTLFLSRKTF